MTELAPEPGPKSGAVDLRRGGIALGAVAIGGYLLDYGFNLGLARFLSPHDYGDFKVATSFAFFFGLAVLLGGDRAAPMVLAPCLERDEPRRVWEYLRYYLFIASLLSLAVIAITWTLSALHVGSNDPQDHHPLAWVVVAVPIQAVGAMISRTLQASRRPVRAVVPWRLGLPVAQLALFAAVIAFRGQLAVSEALAISIVAAALITLWHWLDVRRLGLFEIERDTGFRQPRAWLMASLPMMGSFLAALALSQSDLYFLELLGDDAEVGHYAAAAMAAHFVPLAQVTLVGLIAPVAAVAIARGADASRATFRRSQSMMLGVLIPVAAFLALAGEPILALFGPRYKVGYMALALLVVGNFAWAVAALPSLWLQYQRRARIVLIISLATLAVDSVLNWLLIPRHGMLGAASSTALTLTAAAIAVVWCSWRGRSDC